MEEKKNLTLRINKEVLEKAKKLGLNLSSVTEGFLKTVSFAGEKKVVRTKELRDYYRKAFMEIIDLMQEWGITSYLEIGGHSEEQEFIDSKGNASSHVFSHEYLLTPEGIIEHYLSDFEKTLNKWKLNEDWPVQYVYESGKIISNLVDLLYRRAEKNKEKVEDLNILKSVLGKLRGRKEEKNEI